LKIKNIGSGSGFWLITGHKWVEIFNFLNFSRIVYDIMMNFLIFSAFLKHISKFGVKKGKDPDPVPDLKLIISDPDPDP